MQITASQDHRPPRRLRHTRIGTVTRVSPRPVRACKHGDMGESPELDGPAAGAAAPRRRLNLLGWIPRPLRHGITIFILLLFVEYFLIPSFLHSKARSSLSQLGRVNFLWFLAGIALEAAALMSAAAMARQDGFPADPFGAAQKQLAACEPKAAASVSHAGAALVVPFPICVRISRVFVALPASAAGAGVAFS